MGDMADDLFDQYSDFDLDGDRTEEFVTCNRCGETELLWAGSNQEGWRLVNGDDKRHLCHLTQAADGFERIE